MKFRKYLTDYSRGDNLWLFWRLFQMRSRTDKRFVRSVLTFLCGRLAHRHGGYVGPGAVIDEIPSLPHGLHGVFISRYAHIGKGCRIYQNVTIGEVDKAAPRIGDGCLIGAGAVIIGGIRIGDHTRIGAGTVVRCDIPDNCTVVSEPPRILFQDERQGRDGDFGWKAESLSEEKEPQGSENS